MLGDAGALAHRLEGTATPPPPGDHPVWGTAAGPAGATFPQAPALRTGGDTEHFSPFFQYQQLRPDTALMNRALRLSKSCRIQPFQANAVRCLFSLIKKKIFLVPLFFSSLASESSTVP